LSNKPIALLEGYHQLRHPLVLSGVITPISTVRVAPWPDNSDPTHPGLTSAQMVQQGQAVVRELLSRPPEFRFLQIIGALRRSCDPSWPYVGGEYPLTVAQVVRGLLNKCFLSYQDIAAVAPLVKLFDQASIVPAGIWIDAEDGPEFNVAKYADIVRIWQQSTGGDANRLADEVWFALNQSAITIANACGWANADVITAESHSPLNPRGCHWWQPTEIGASKTSSARYCHVEPKDSPDSFRKQLMLATEQNVKAVIIWGEDITAEQLSAHGPALTELTLAREVG
jgi:hypothetical protein